MTHYRWGFDLVNVNSVESLSWAVPGPDVAILRDEEDAMPAVLHFSSQHLNDLDDPAEVVARGNALKALFDGALYLSIGARHRREPLRELWDLRGERRMGKPDPAHGVAPFSVATCGKPLTDLETAIVLGRFTEGALYCARTDRAVFGILYSLGRDGVDWKTLYALTDTMNNNGMSSDQQAKAAGTTQAEYKLFKHTANSFAALGPDARHGETPHQPPANPMTLDRASDLVLGAARAFVRKRITRATTVVAAARDTERSGRAELLAKAKASRVTTPVVEVATEDKVVESVAHGRGRAAAIVTSREAPKPAMAIGLAVLAVIVPVGIAAVAAWTLSRNDRNQDV